MHLMKCDICGETHEFENRGAHKVCESCRQPVACAIEEFKEIRYLPVKAGECYFCDRPAHKPKSKVCELHYWTWNSVYANAYNELIREHSVKMEEYIKTPVKETLQDLHEESMAQGISYGNLVASRKSLADGYEMRLRKEAWEERNRKILAQREFERMCENERMAENNEQKPEG